MPETMKKQIELGEDALTLIVTALILSDHLINLRMAKAAEYISAITQLRSMMDQRQYNVMLGSLMVASGVITADEANKTLHPDACEHCKCDSGDTCCYCGEILP